MRQRHRTLWPLAGAHKTISGRQLAGRTEHQANGQIGHVVVQHVGRVADHHATGLGGLHVDAVIAHTHHRNDLQRRQLVDQLGADL